MLLNVCMFVHVYMCIKKLLVFTMEEVLYGKTDPTGGTLEVGHDAVECTHVCTYVYVHKVAAFACLYMCIYALKSRMFSL